MELFLVVSETAFVGVELFFAAIGSPLVVSKIAFIDDKSISSAVDEQSDSVGLLFVPSDTDLVGWLIRDSGLADLEIFFAIACSPIRTEAAFSGIKLLPSAI